MFSEYFNASVVSREIEYIKKKRRIRLFKTEIYEEQVFRLIVEITGTRFTLSIPVEEEVYHCASKGDSLSVYLRCKYEFSSYHFIPRKEEVKKIKI